MDLFKKACMIAGGIAGAGIGLPISAGKYIFRRVKGDNHTDALDSSMETMEVAISEGADFGKAVTPFCEMYVGHVVKKKVKAYQEHQDQLSYEKGREQFRKGHPWMQNIPSPSQARISQAMLDNQTQQDFLRRVHGTNDNNCNHNKQQ